MIVVHRPHPAPLRAGDHDIADVERATLNQHGGHRAAPAIDLGLDHNPLGGAVRVCRELEQLRLQQNRLF